jgi:monoamine oxidase
MHARELPIVEKAMGIPYPLPTYARDEVFSSYEGSVGWSWVRDPYAGGSYSTIAPGQSSLLTKVEEVNGESVKSLFAPIDGTLYFAGEHASILSDVPGTMEAACESGERIARMVAKQK